MPLRINGSRPYCGKAYSITFSIAAIAAVTVLFASGPLVANQQVQAFGFFHHHFSKN